MNIMNVAEFQDKCLESIKKPGFSHGLYPDFT